MGPCVSFFIATLYFSSQKKKMIEQTITESFDEWDHANWEYGMSMGVYGTYLLLILIYVVKIR